MFHFHDEMQYVLLEVQQFFKNEFGTLTLDLKTFF